MRLIRSIIAAGVVVGTVGCATSGQVNAGGVTRLEKSRAARPNDPAVARSLGIAYYKQGKFAEARTHLDQAVKLDPRDGSATLYLGLTHEQLKDVAGAKAAYQAYVRFGRTSKVRKQLEARLAALTRQELQVAAKAAVQREQQLVAQQGSNRTVAVLPLEFSGPDTSLKPLERGMAELITIDLARSHQLTVVERARIQALLDEIRLQQSGATEATTNVRAGKIIQAGRLVSGKIQQDAQRLRVDAAIVNTQTSALAGGAANENTLEQLFAIEKAIVKQLFDSLGVTLTAEELKALELTPTRSFQAFLAYSRGLMLEDQGRFGDAARSYNDALRIDPGFLQAQQKGTQTSQAAIGVQLNVAAIESNLAGTTEETIASRSQQGEAPPSSGANTDNSAVRMASDLNPSVSQDATNRAGSGGATTTIANTPVRDALGGDGSTKRANVTIIIRIPNP